MARPPGSPVAPPFRSLVKAGLQRIVLLQTMFAAVSVLNSCTSTSAPEASNTDAGASAPEQTSDSGSRGGSFTSEDHTSRAPTTEPTEVEPSSLPSAGLATSEGFQSDGESEAPSVQLPPVNGGLDYQLGGSYAPPDGVQIVSLDRTAPIVPGLYNICYVNGFQVQPGEEDSWDQDLLLRDGSGELVIDEDWDEVLLDISTAQKRSRITDVVGAWIIQCADDGFDAVEVDNLDTFTRSGNMLTQDDAVAFTRGLADIAHGAGLAIAQKNAVELVDHQAEMQTDFVVAEECNVWDECDGYIEGYGPYVLMVEYTRGDFESGCKRYGAEFSLVLRDRNLTVPSAGAYVFEGC